MIGGALGYDSLGTLRIDNHRATVDGDGIHGGLGVRHAGAGGAQLAALVSGGWQWNHNSRAMDIFGPAIGTSDQSSSYAQANAEAAYVLGGTVFARPALRGSVTGPRQNGFPERGLAGLGVESLAHIQWIATASPELTLGVQLSGTPGAGAVLSVTGGGDFHSTGRIVAPFRLLGANPAADPALIGTGIDRSGWHLGAQLPVAGNDRFAVRLNYDRRFGERATSESFGVDARLKF